MTAYSNGLTTAPGPTSKRCDSPSQCPPPEKRRPSPATPT
nr:MAG TPA: hypothetical protein [Caudoviricetes sp.]